MKLSKTQINMFLRCPFQYQCRYVDGLKMPSTSMILLGRCFDTAINHNYNEKIKSGKDEKVTVVKDVFNDEFKNNKDDIIFQEDEKPEALKDSGINTTGYFHKTICKTVKPKEVQIKSEISFDNVDYSLLVVVDLVDAEKNVIDNKFTSRTWAAGKEYAELDPIIYSLWFEQNYKEPENSFRFDIGINTKEPKTDQRKVVISKESKEGFLKYLAVIQANIQNCIDRGIFYPNTGNMLCSRKNCGYWNICERAWKHRIKD